MKAFFVKVIGFLHIIFGFNLDAWINDHVQPAIDLVQNLRKFIDSPVTNIITCLIPGDIAEHIRQTVSANLAKAIDILHPNDETVNETDLESKTLKFIAWVKTLSATMQAGVFHGLATTLTKLSAGVTGETIKNHSIDLLVQSQYSAQKSGISDEAMEGTIKGPQAEEPAATEQNAVPESPAPAAPVDKALEHANIIAQAQAAAATQQTAVPAQ